MRGSSSNTGSNTFRRRYRRSLTLSSFEGHGSYRLSFHLHETRHEDQFRRVYAKSPVAGRRNDGCNVVEYDRYRSLHREGSKPVHEAMSTHYKSLTRREEHTLMAE